METTEKNDKMTKKQKKQLAIVGALVAYYAMQQKKKDPQKLGPTIWSASKPVAVPQGVDTTSDLLGWLDGYGKAPVREPELDLTVPGKFE